eukprot:6425262-Amphidinium_carterae.1
MAEPSKPCGRWQVGSTMPLGQCLMLLVEDCGWTTAERKSLSIVPYAFCGETEGSVSHALYDCPAVAAQRRQAEVT